MNVLDNIKSGEYQAKLIGENIIRISALAVRMHSPGNSLHRYGFLKESEVMSADQGGDVQVSPTTGGFLVNAGAGSWSLEFKVRENEDGGYEVSWPLESEEALYGLGDHTRERINHRGEVVKMHVANVSSYIPIPFLMSSKGYGVLVNTTYSHEWDLGKRDNGQARIQARNGLPDFYIFIGDGFKALLDRYTSLSGRPALPPKWSFGLWFVCRMQADVHEVMSDVLNFRDRQIPCDVIGLEPGWMETEYDYSTEKRWSKERFPIPAYNPRHNFISAMKRMGFKLSLWLCQNYDLSYEAERKQLSDTSAAPDPEGRKEIVHEDDADGDVRLRGVVLSDTLTKPKEPWFEHLKKFVDQGADMFKQDGSLQVNEHPDRLWGNGMTDAEMHNLYPNLYSQQMYEGFKEYTGRRPCCFSAAGWTGLQRHVGTWTGDTGGEEKTLVACLNLAMAGHSLVTCDMEVTTPEGIHYGFLLPWSQVNSWNYFRHPWLLGDELSRVFNFYARFRSRLVPYLYTYARVGQQTGCPILRPLVLEFPHDKQTSQIKTQWMLGSELMVSGFSKDVYFPVGGRWVDLWSGKIFEGGQSIHHVPAANRGGGLFLRQNGALLLGPVRQYVDQVLEDSGMELHLALPEDGSADFELYDDDGVSFRYEMGEFQLFGIKAVRRNEQVEVTVSGDLRINDVFIYSETKVTTVVCNGVSYSVVLSEMLPNRYECLLT